MLCGCKKRVWDRPRAKAQNTMVSLSEIKLSLGKRNLANVSTKTIFYPTGPMNFLSSDQAHNRFDTLSESQGCKV
ncbi:hypothetical protein QG37_00975 [Candidozyma auris]|nr:hypothetical protein QG37_00975 [[Candida] auris]